MQTCTSFWLKCLWVDVGIHVNLSNINVLRTIIVGKNNFKTLIYTPLVPVMILSLGTLSFKLSVSEPHSGSRTAGTSKLACSQKPGISEKLRAGPANREPGQLPPEPVLQPLTQWKKDVWADRWTDRKCMGMSKPSQNFANIYQFIEKMHWIFNDAISYTWNSVDQR